MAKDGSQEETQTAALEGKTGQELEEGVLQKQETPLSMSKCEADCGG